MPAMRQQASEMPSGVRNDKNGLWRVYTRGIHLAILLFH